MNITGGEFKGQKIIAPDERITRPTLSKVRMAVFNTLQTIMDFEGKTFCDMYAGSGIMGLEALSRGFGKLYASEKNNLVLKILKSNYKKFENMREIYLYSGDSVKNIEKILSSGEKFDVTYIDPPYLTSDIELAQKVYENSINAVKGNSEIIIVEHVIDINFIDFNVLKQKRYGDKIITFIS